MKRNLRSHATVMAVAKAVACLVVTASLLPPQAVVRALTRGPVSFVLPQLWHRAMCRVLAIEVERRGEIDMRAGTVYVGNHISHFDIFVLGSCVRAAFIAKGEMAGWPGMKLLGAMQQTLFVSRRARDAAQVATQIAKSRRRGQRLVLFAEGTTTAGVTVAPFKSSLFSMFFGEGMANAQLQPFTVELIGVDGHALRDADDRDLYALHGNMAAGAHVWRFLRARGARVRISFHPPLQMGREMTRKSLAAAAHAAVGAGLESS